jgi:hypothetical protein
MMLLRVATTVVSTLALLESLVGLSPLHVVNVCSHQPRFVFDKDAGHARVTKYISAEFKLAGLIDSALLKDLTSGFKDVCI